MANFKIVKKLDNGFLIQECLLTKQWETLVKDLEKNWMSNEWIASVLMPYDSTKKTQEKNKNLVSCLAIYLIKIETYKTR